jgi:hypothetical protein
MSLEPSTPIESAPPAEVPLTAEPAASSPVPPVPPAVEAPLSDDELRKVRRQIRLSRPRRIWRAAVSVTLVVSMFVNLILIVTVLILVNQVGAIKATLNGVLGQLDLAFQGLGEASIKDTISINQQVPVRFDLPLSQNTVVTTQAAVPINTQATFSLGQFGSINGTVSLQLPPGTQLPVHLELVVPVSNTIPVVFDQPINIPLAERGLAPVVAQLRAALAPIIDIVDQIPDRFVIIPQ